MNICAQDLEVVSISMNKWWKTRYSEYNLRVVSKKEFGHVKIKEQQNPQ